MVDNPLNHKIEFIKGVGPNKAAALKKELGISQLKDMLDFFPENSLKSFIPYFNIAILSIPIPKAKP